MDKRFWGVIGVIVVIFVGIVIANGHKGDSADGSKSGNAQPTNHIEGSGATGVKLVEYGDFECPVCYAYYPTVKEVVDKHKADIVFQFRNFPLTQVHKNAFAGARAAEAAAIQNKYWEMHDKLYENQDPNGASGWVASASPQTFFNDYAQQLGLNVTQFKKDYTSDAVNNAINADVQEGNKLKVSGTPTFYLNGKTIELKDIVGDTGPSADKFNKILDDAIAQAKKTN